MSTKVDQEDGLEADDHRQQAEREGVKRGTDQVDDHPGTNQQHVQRKERDRAGEACDRVGSRRHRWRPSPLQMLLPMQLDRGVFLMVSVRLCRSSASSFAVFSPAAAVSSIILPALPRMERPPAHRIRQVHR